MLNAEQDMLTDVTLGFMRVCPGFSFKCCFPMYLSSLFLSCRPFDIVTFNLCLCSVASVCSVFTQQCLIKETFDVQLAP